VSAYYNEIDPFAAQWLRNLIAAGHIAPGDVDERSIVDVKGDDLVGYTQCHFFAGIGVWSYALRLAGWDDDRPVWSGSCPCQPFSAAGKREGFADERHLWPTWFELIRERHPLVVFGEQVASKDGLGWLDSVHADLEGASYACGAVDMCAAGVGAPHIRQRLWFVAYAAARGRGEQSTEFATSSSGACGHTDVCGGNGGLAYTSIDGDRQHARELHGHEKQDRPLGADASIDGGTACVVGDAHSERRARVDALLREENDGRLSAAEVLETSGSGAARLVGDADVARSQGLVERRLGADQWAAWAPSVVGGFWQDADLIYCRDEKWRPVEPGTFPLAHGAPARVGRLRAYGNAIVAEVAKEFIAAAMDVMP
jgi:DNA (cytosine-5)-methyltransferase 1